MHMHMHMHTMHMHDMHMHMHMHGMHGTWYMVHGVHGVVALTIAPKADSTCNPPPLCSFRLRRRSFRLRRSG